MDADAIARLPECDEFRALTILDVVRTDLKKGLHSHTLPLSHGQMLAILRAKLNPSAPAAAPLSSRASRKPSEEVTIAIIQLLVEYTHASTAGAPAAGEGDIGATRATLIAAVASVIPDLMPFVGRERVRRACGVLVTSAMKRCAPACAGSIVTSLCEVGMQAEDDSVRKGAIALVPEVFKAVGNSLSALAGAVGDGSSTSVSDLFLCLAARLVDPSPSVVSAAEKALGRIKAGDAPGYAEHVAELPTSLQHVLSSHGDGIRLREKGTSASTSSAVGGVAGSALASGGRPPSTERSARGAPSTALGSVAPPSGSAAVAPSDFTLVGARVASSSISSTSAAPADALVPVSSSSSANPVALSAGMLAPAPLSALHSAGSFTHGSPSRAGALPAAAADASGSGRRERRLESKQALLRASSSAEQSPAGPLPVTQLDMRADGRGISTDGVQPAVAAPVRHLKPLPRDSIDSSGSAHTPRQMERAPSTRTMVVAEERMPTPRTAPVHDEMLLTLRRESHVSEATTATIETANTLGTISPGTHAPIPAVVRTAANIAEDSYGSLRSSLSVKLLKGTAGIPAGVSASSAAQASAPTAAATFEFTVKGMSMSSAGTGEGGSAPSIARASSSAQTGVAGTVSSSSANINVYQQSSSAPLTTMIASGASDRERRAQASVAASITATVSTSTTTATALQPQQPKRPGAAGSNGSSDRGSSHTMVSPRLSIGHVTLSDAPNSGRTSSGGDALAVSTASSLPASVTHSASSTPPHTTRSSVSAPTTPPSAAHAHDGSHTLAFSDGNAARKVRSRVEGAAHHQLPAAESQQQYESTGYTNAMHVMEMRSSSSLHVPREVQPAQSLSPQGSSAAFRAPQVRAEDAVVTDAPAWMRASGMRSGARSQAGGPVLADHSLRFMNGGAGTLPHMQQENLAEDGPGELPSVSVALEVQSQQGSGYTTTLRRGSAPVTSSAATSEASPNDADAASGMPADGIRSQLDLLKRRSRQTSRSRRALSANVGTSATASDAGNDAVLRDGVSNAPTESASRYSAASFTPSWNGGGTDAAWRADAPDSSMLRDAPVMTFNGWSSNSRSADVSTARSHVASNAMPMAEEQPARTSRAVRARPGAAYSATPTVSSSSSADVASPFGIPSSLRGLSPHPTIVAARAELQPDQALQTSLPSSSRSHGSASSWGFTAAQRYDRAALNDEFGVDPYEGMPPSPAKGGSPSSSSYSGYQQHHYATHGMEGTSPVAHTSASAGRGYLSMESADSSSPPRSRAASPLGHAAVPAYALTAAASATTTAPPIVEAAVYRGRARTLPATLVGVDMSDGHPGPASARGIAMRDLARPSPRMGEGDAGDDLILAGSDDRPIRPLATSEAHMYRPPTGDSTGPAPSPSASGLPPRAGLSARFGGRRAGSGSAAAGNDTPKRGASPARGRYPAGPPPSAGGLYMDVPEVLAEIAQGPPSTASSGSRRGSSSVAAAPPAALSGIPSTAAPSEPLYTPSAALEPLSSTDAALRCASNELRSTDWEKQCEALNCVRRLALFHTSVLSSSSGLSGIVKGVALAADSLRSAVAKNAMLAIADLFMHMPRALDTDMEAIVTVLVKRCSDTSAFIAAASDGAMAALILHGNDGRVLPALLATSAHKNGSIHSKSSIWLDRLTARTGLRTGAVARDLERVIAAAATYMGEGNPEARYAGHRMILRVLQTGAMDEAALSRTMNDRQWMRVKLSLEKSAPPPDSFDPASALHAVVHTACSPAVSSTPLAFGLPSPSGSAFDVGTPLPSVTPAPASRAGVPRTRSNSRMQASSASSRVSTEVPQPSLPTLAPARANLLPRV